MVVLGLVTLFFVLVKLVLVLQTHVMLVMVLLVVSARHGSVGARWAHVDACHARCCGNCVGHGRAFPFYASGGCLGGEHGGIRAHARDGGALVSKCVGHRGSENDDQTLALMV